MQFVKEYYRGMKYRQREQLVKRSVQEIIKWGSEVSNHNLFNGRSKTALDVGCAYGFAVSFLESLGYETYGIDISRHSVRQAKMSCAGNLLVCDAQTNLPFKNKTFDLITCFDVLEHLRNPLNAIKSMFDLCKAVMIYATPNKAVEKPIRKIIRDYDKTHISVKLPAEWEKCIHDSLNSSFIKIETFFDLPLKVAGNLIFFKSLKVPCFGLTVRILVRK